MSKRDEAPIDRVHRRRVFNTTNETIPPFAVMRVIDYAGDNAFSVGRPNRDSYPFGLMFNGRMPIRPGQIGTGTTDTTFWAAYQFEGSASGSGSEEGSDGSGSLGPSPQVGEVWGPRAGSWYLSDQRTGFMVLSTDDFDLNAVMVTIYPDFSGLGNLVKVRVVVEKCEDTVPPSGSA